MQEVYKKIEEYNTDKERKILIVFDDMIADIINNKKLNSVKTELFIRGRKLNISLVFVTQSYFKVPKDVSHQTLTLRISLRSTKNVLLNHILFWLMMLHLHQITL